MKISKVLVVINQGKGHAVKTARQLKQILNKYAVKQEWVALAALTGVQREREVGEVMAPPGGR